jgi:hypothetical protein
MRSVTSDFLASQKDPSPVGVRHLYYKRRYWNGSSFSWEGSWTELPLTKIVSISAINWQLDNDQLNEFKVSNVTVNVDNSDNYWRPDNTSTGFFKTDSGSPTYGYEPYWTKFQLRAGFFLPDGVTEEVVTLFTGLLVDYNMDSDTKQAQLQLQGQEILLINTKAESIGTAVTNELTGTGNGATTQFTTANPGVGDITAVRVNGVTQVLGVDYTLSQQNSTSLGCKITFTVAPTNTYPVRTDYYYWPQNKQFSELVTLLLTAAGISSGNQLVQATLFSNAVVNTFSYQSAADFNTGTLSQLLDTEHTGMLEIDWTNAGNYTVTTWSTTTSGWTINSSGATAGTTSDGTYLILTSGASGSGADNTRVTRASTPGIGMWEFEFTHTTANKPNLSFNLGAGTWSFGFPTGLQLQINASGVFYLYEDQGGGAGTTWTPDTSAHTVRLKFVGETVYVYLDGVLKITYASLVATAQFTTIGFQLIHANGITTANTTKIRTITTPVATASGTWISPTIDLTGTPTVWGTMTIVDGKGGLSSSIVYSTDVSADNFGTHDGYTNISAGNVPQSTLRRYVKIKATFSYPTNTWPRSTGQGDPYVDGIIFSATTTSTAVLLPNFAGQSVYDAIQAIGEYTNYEFGFNPDETFFFRSRTLAASVMTLTGADYIGRISGMDSGYSRVYAVVRATYGAYVREAIDTGLTRTSPAARVSNARYEITPDSNIQIATTADIASGVAASLLTYLSYPKRRCRVVTKFLPQLELSDVVTIQLYNNLPEAVWYWGDLTAYWGRNDIYWWSTKDQFIGGITFKVIGARFDVDKFNCELNLEEVVS